MRLDDILETASLINSYYQAKNEGIVVSNVGKLISLVKKYVDTFVYLKNNSLSDGLVKVDGEVYQMKANTSEGYSVGLDSIFLDLLNKTVSDISKFASDELFVEYLTVSNGILCRKDLGTDFKAALMQAESEAFGNHWILRMVTVGYELSKVSVENRRALAVLILSGRFGDLKYDSKDELLESVNKSLVSIIRQKVRLLIGYNKIIDVVPYILSEINFIRKNKSDLYDKPRVIFDLLYQIVLMNNLFHVKKRKEIREILKLCSKFIDDKGVEAIERGINFDPEGFSLSDFSVGMAFPDFSSVNEAEVETIISFIVPYEMEAGKTSVTVVNDNFEIEFSRLYNFFDDPVYLFLDSIDMNMDGLPATFFSDSIGRLNSSSKVTIKYKDFIHPDFEVVDGGLEYLENFEEKSKRGGVYHPYKDILLESLWMAFDNNDIPFDISKKDIISNLISNYLVSYVQNGNLVHHKIYLVTNFDSFCYVRDKYIKSMTDIYLDEDHVGIYDLINRFEIKSKSRFLDFCVSLIRLTVARSIENSSLHKMFWDDKGEPRSEIECQPLIYDQIRYLSDIKGIKFLREINSADGSVDFTFLYSLNGEMVSVCVELKLAHNKNLIHGISDQLPLYMKDMGTRKGIFLVLWFKDKFFVKPSQYESVIEMENELRAEIPKGYEIKLVTIDTTKKLSPSNPKRKL